MTLINNLRVANWKKTDPESFPLVDYLNEQSMAKVWHKGSSHDRDDFRNLFNIKTVDVMDMIAKEGLTKLTPKSSCVIDSRSTPEPQNYKILRELLIDNMTIVSVKQQKNNPRNVVFAIRPKRELSGPQTLTMNNTFSEKTMAIYMVGTLTEKYDSMTNLFVIR